MKDRLIKITNKLLSLDWLLIKKEQKKNEQLSIWKICKNDQQVTQLACDKVETLSMIQRPVTMSFLMTMKKKWNRTQRRSGIKSLLINSWTMNFRDKRICME